MTFQNNLGRTQILLLKNNTGGTVSQGDPCIVDPADSSAFVTNNILGNYDCVPAVVYDLSIASGAYGLMATGGYIPKLNLTASASLGDFAKLSNTVKKAVSHSGSKVSGDFAQVMGTGTSPAAVMFTPAILGGSTPSNLVKVSFYKTGAVQTGINTLIPYDDTIPQNTEGTQIFTLAHTPSNASNLLYFDIVLHFANTGAYQGISALFQDTTADALAVGTIFTGTTNQTYNLKYSYSMTAGTTSATTFKVRLGTSNVSGTITLNGSSGARKFGGVLFSSIKITEVLP